MVANITTFMAPIVSGIAEEKDKHPAAWIAFILAIFISFLLWSIYFDMTSEQDTKKGYRYLQYLIFLHFPLLASFSALGGTMRAVLTNLNADEHNTAQWIFCVAIAVILLTIVGVASIMEEEEEDRIYIIPVSRLLILAAIAILAVPLFGKYMNTLGFLGTVSVILLVPVVIGIRSWVRFKFFGRK